MAITRSQIARQLLAEGGAPRKGFYVGGSPADSQNNPSPSSSSNDGNDGFGGEEEFRPTYSQQLTNIQRDNDNQFDTNRGFQPVRKNPLLSIAKGGLDLYARATIPGYNTFRTAQQGLKLANKFGVINTGQFKNTNTGDGTPPTVPDGENETGIVQAVQPVMPVIPKLPTDVETPESDIQFVQRFTLPERFQAADGGEVSIDDAERMAPPGESLAYINDDEAALLRAIGGAGEPVNQTGIPSYFIKKVFKKAKKAVKKIVKSDLGKAALAGAALYYGGGGSLFGLQRAGMSGFQFGNLPGASLFGKGSLNPFKMAQNPGGTQFGLSKFGSLANKFGIVSDAGKVTKLGKAAGLIGASTLGGLAAGGTEDEVESTAQRIADKTGLDIQAIRKEVQDATAQGQDALDALASKYPFLVQASDTRLKDGGRAKKKKVFKYRKKPYGPKFAAEGGLAALKDGGEVSIGQIEMLIKRGADNDLIKTYVDGAEDGVIDQIREAMKKRKKKKDGGVMSLGGMEMDLRGGGFVPLGKKEKADDVPARLSKNEFVFTADAVKAAGGGDVDKGADLMYKTMKQLENRVL